MKKVRASIAMLTATAMAAGIMLVSAGLQAERPVNVRTVRVAIGEVAQLTVLTGAVRYQEEYAALAPITGVVAQVYVQPGDAVTAGQALFRMDDTQEVAAMAAVWGAGEEVAAFAGTAQAAAQARKRLETLTVRAQTDGFVQQVAVTRHAGVTLGMPAMLLTGQGQAVVCPAVVKDAAALQPGMRARILFGGVTACMGTVEAIGPAQAETTTGQVLCEVRLLPDEPLSLPLGAAVEAEIIHAAAEGVTVLPLTALTEAGTVWWVCDGRAWETPVTAPLRDEVYAWVSLPEGAVVVDGAAELYPGQQVREVAQ